MLDEALAACVAAAWEQGSAQDGLDMAIVAAAVANPHLAFAVEAPVAESQNGMTVKADLGRQQDLSVELDKGHADMVAFAAAKMAVS